VLLGQIVGEFTDRLNRGEQPDIEEYVLRHPSSATSVRELLLPLLALRLKIAASESGADSQAISTAPKGCLGDYEIIREIGRGGMGVVYEAEQLTLHRRVALKVLLFPASLDPKRLQRFQQEAQAAARLHHTNIVPVFGVGCEQGLHFYAMQYIKGQSLDAVIHALQMASAPVPPYQDRGSHSLSAQGSKAASVAPLGPENHPTEAPPPQITTAETVQAFQDTLASQQSGDWRGYYRTVARLGMQAAEALDHAHEQGVIHRDIKPANLLLDDRGTLWITDFGMAQVSAGGCLTQDGDLLGTLRYMSPEQARGKRGVLDERTDIYSLGITLYEFATLKPAFPAQDRQELLAQITSGEPVVPPRKLNRAIPRELETILLKAISKAPEERYQTAKALADDLRRFLEDRPILARRPSLLERVVKWSRRHKGVVWALGGGMIIATVALAASTVMVWQAKRHTEAAYLSEARSRQRARQAANDMYTQIVEKWLVREPQMEETQREFLLKALRFYEEEAEEQGTGAPERYERALAYKRVADIQFRLGNDAAALLAYEQAISLFQELKEALAGKPDCLLNLARCHAAWGAVAGQTGRTTAAEQAQRHAVLIAEQLVSDFPNDPQCRVALVVFRINLGSALYSLGRSEEVEAIYGQALTNAEQLVREFPNEPIYQNRLAGVLHQWAHLARDLGHPSQAEELYRGTLVVLGKLVTDHPADPAYKSGRAGISRSLGDLLLQNGMLVEAEKVLSRSVDDLEEVISRYPKTIGYREEAASAWQSVGQLHEAAGQTDEAKKAFRRSIVLYENLLGERPARVSYASPLACLYADCPVEQLRNMARAVELAKKALEVEPDSSRLWITLGVAHYRQGEWKAAASALETGLRQNRPETGRGTFYLAMTYALRGDGERASRFYEQAVKWMDKNQPRNPDLVRMRAEAGEVLKVPDSLRRN
jgi:serine/threonine protein kinase